MTQKCIVTKIKLYDLDGNVGLTRPPESRLFRPTDSFEDLSTMTLSLQEALSREKMLEDKLVLVKSMISKNIGKSHTDLLRLFENIKEELMNLYEQREVINSNKAEEGMVDKLVNENHALKKEIKGYELNLESKDQEIVVLQKKSQADNVELTTLRKATQLQKDSMYNMEIRLEQALEDSSRIKLEAEAAKIEALKENERQMSERENEMEKEKQAIQKQLQDVLSNEANLLNRIRSLEAEESYARTEVDRVLTRERETTEMNQTLQYRVECLESEVAEARDIIEEQQGQVVVKRSDEDIAKIEEQEGVIHNLQQEVGYVKKELIEARAHKSASDDKLSTVQDKIETLQNNINSLTDEGNKCAFLSSRIFAYHISYFSRKPIQKDHFEFRRRIANQNHRIFALPGLGGQNGSHARPR